MNLNQQILLERITINPGLMSGRPTIRNMRFPVSDILEMLASGMTEAEILTQHPILEEADIQAAYSLQVSHIQLLPSYTKA